MKITVKPPFEQWSPADRAGSLVVATGHQAALWHPGILAKYAAVAGAAKKFGAKPLHVVVDQDQHETMALDVPRVDGDRIVVDRAVLGETNPNVPTGMQPPVNAHSGVAVIDRALRTVGAKDTLAQQVAALLAELYRPFVGEIETIFASELLRDSNVVDQMLADGDACILHYNAAVSEYPGAGIAPLEVRDDRVELPLWRMLWQTPRRRVFVHGDQLIDERGEEITDRNELAPRALLLTAVMRSERCHLFIHGTGGYVYDRITESWWQHWTGETLAPMALVTADLHLQFDAPVCDRETLQRAAWWAHHVPHNIDRALSLEGDMVRRKRELLDHMDDDRDRARRARAFGELHDINAQWVAKYGHLVQEAQHALRQARAGVANRRTAMRRDWCFALYPAQQLHELCQAFT